MPRENLFQILEQVKRVCDNKGHMTSVHRQGELHQGFQWDEAVPVGAPFHTGR